MIIQSTPVKGWVYRSSTLGGEASQVLFRSSRWENLENAEKT